MCVKYHKSDGKTRTNETNTFTVHVDRQTTQTIFSLCHMI
jgi:hypothetical protein